MLGEVMVKTKGQYSQLFWERRKLLRRVAQPGTKQMLRAGQGCWQDPTRPAVSLAKCCSLAFLDLGPASLRLRQD